MTTTADVWYEKLKKVLCALYLNWGGDCVELFSPAQASTLVLDTYAAKGAPTFSSQADKNEFLLSLGALQGVLEDPDNELPSGMTAQLKQMIVDLQKQLG